MKKYTFSGHDTFQCRHFWLKKGYDFVSSGRSFNEDDATIALGVGKNMVSSIRFWMKAFGLLTKDDNLTPFAIRLLAEDGWDPFLEDEGTLWLLHYHLLKTDLASTYPIIFNELRREKIEFTKSHFVSFIKRKADTTGEFQVSENTLKDDFTVFTKMYLRSGSHSSDKEESYSGILTELDLIKLHHRNKEDHLIIENNDKVSLPALIVLYAILESNDFDSSISLNALEQQLDNVGSAFALSRTGLLNKIEEICMLSSNSIVYNDHAGIKEIQFKEKPNSLTVLDNYYAN